jgi:hypothetical protein
MKQSPSEMTRTLEAQFGPQQRPQVHTWIREHWGPQAWIDMWILDAVLVKHGQPLVAYTLVPMIRLVADDPSDVDARFKEFCSANERVRWLDSPRERWRKRYGRFVREIEWAFLELRRHFSQSEYERIVVESATAIMYERIGGVLKFANTALNPGEQARYGAKSSASVVNRGFRARMNNALVRLIDPSRFAHFLTGDGTVTNVDIAKGQLDVDIPDCAWHRVAPSSSLPVLGQLPEQGCLVMCKATCENVFDGRDGLRIEFEPHLPETSCTMRIRW